jgi:hypothetical protein
MDRGIAFRRTIAVSDRHRPRFSHAELATDVGGNRTSGQKHLHLDTDSSPTVKSVVISSLE